MDVRLLSRFVHIAELGSFSRAARKLSVAQPALSQQIRRLEQDLGVSLLDRRSNGVQLTPAGVRLLHHSKLILRQLELARGDMLECSEEIKGHVVVGLPASISPILSVPLIENVRERFPGISIHLIENLSGYLREWTQSGRIDVSLLFDVPPSSGMAVTPLLREELWIAGNRDSLPMRELPLAALSQYPLVMPAAPHGLRTLVEAAALEQKLKLNIVQELESAAIIMALIKRNAELFTIQGMGALHMERVSGGIAVARIVDPPITRPVTLATSAAKPANRAAVEIKTLITELVSQLVQSGAWEGRLVDALLPHETKPASCEDA